MTSYSTITLPDKIALANRLAQYLAGTDFDLSVELAERDLIGLLNDPQFREALAERLDRCEACGFWFHADTTCDCDDGDDWDYD